MKSEPCSSSVRDLHHEYLEELGAGSLYVIWHRRGRSLGNRYANFLADVSLELPA